MYKWEVINLSTGEISEPQRRFRTKINAVKNVVTFIQDPMSSIDRDHSLTVVIRDSRGDVVGGMKDFPAGRIMEVQILNSSRRLVAEWQS